MADPYSNVKSFVRATADEARAVVRGAEPVPAAEVRRRLGICGACPNLAGGVCAACSCIVALKARYRTQACPEGRWG